VFVLGTKRTPLLESLGLNIWCWGASLVAAGRLLLAANSIERQQKLHPRGFPPFRGTPTTVEISPSLSVVLRHYKGAWGLGMRLGARSTQGLPSGRPPYPMLVLEKAKRASRTGNPDRPYRAPVSCGIADLRSPAPTSRRGSLLAHLGRAEGGPMITADTSTWVAFLEGREGEDAQLLDRALDDRQVLAWDGLR
jgi:hypothetical protein